MVRTDVELETFGMIDPEHRGVSILIVEEIERVKGGNDSKYLSFICL